MRSMNANQSFPIGTRVSASVPGTDVLVHGVTVADTSRVRVIARDNQPKVCVLFDGHTSPVPFNVSQLRREVPTAEQVARDAHARHLRREERARSGAFDNFSDWGRP